MAKKPPKPAAWSHRATPRGSVVIRELIKTKVQPTKEDT